MNEPLLGELETVASGIYLEGLAVDCERNIVWYSDVIAGGIHGQRPDGSTLSLNTDRMWTGGISLNTDGAVLSSGRGGIMWNNPLTGASGWLLQEIDGEPINGVNEMTPDGRGGLIFGTCDLDMVIQGGQTRPTRIYRLTADREVIKLADDIGFSNGLVYDSSRNKLYCNDTFHGTWVFDVRSDLTLANRRMFLEKEDVDGMALDADGNVWITGFRSSSITRVSPQGERLSPVAEVAGAITQIRFGGQDRRDLYINTVPIDGGDSLKVGEIPTEKLSVMYRARCAIPGRAIEPAQFRLGQ